MLARTHSIESFMDWVHKRNPGQSEFHQAVREVAETLLPVIEGNDELKNARVLERLTEPDRIISFRVTWEDDDGNPQVNRGYRVQHSGLIGPYKGGLRFHPTVNESILKFLAFEQTFKNALTGLPMGGGKGGADFDPSGRSEREIMRFCQAFMTELHRHIGSHTDVPAGDINVGSREIGYLFGQYRRLENRFDGALTGKGLAYGGSPCRVEATGYGLIIFLNEMLKAHNASLADQRIVISGAGNVALHAAEKAISEGATVISLSDSGGCLEYSDGLTSEHIKWIKEHKAKPGASLEAFTDDHGGTWHAGGKPWAIECSAALPCATQNELDTEGAQALVANGVKYIAEGANMPCTADAVEVFEKNGVNYAPGKATNAGGVALSGLEMSQNAAFERRDRDDLGSALEEIMTAIHDKCAEHSPSNNDGRIDYVTGANRAAFAKLADAMLAFGVN